MYIFFMLCTSKLAFLDEQLQDDIKSAESNYSTQSANLALYPSNV